MQKQLILWDIDGTILRSAGAGMKALNTALEAVFGLSGTFAGIDFAGRTDLWIIRQIFARFGLDDTPENRAAYIEGYIAALPGILKSSDSGVLPGVQAILERAADHPEFVQGLLTGNLRRGAQTKLGFHGLWDYFPIGAFADDSEVRNELGPHALRRARRHWGVDFPPGRVWIVGDTPHDIALRPGLRRPRPRGRHRRLDGGGPRPVQPGCGPGAPRGSVGLLADPRGVARRARRRYLFAAGARRQIIADPRPPSSMPRTYSIAIGSDHAGFKYKELIKAMLLADGHSVRDMGTDSEQPVDFPDFVRPVAEAVARGEFERGIVLGGSGNGEAIVANRVRGDPLRALLDRAGRDLEPRPQRRQLPVDRSADHLGGRGDQDRAHLALDGF